MENWNNDNFTREETPPIPSHRNPEQTFCINGNDHFITCTNLHERSPFFKQVPTMSKSYYNILIDFLLNYLQIPKVNRLQNNL